MNRFLLKKHRKARIIIEQSYEKFKKEKETNEDGKKYFKNRKKYVKILSQSGQFGKFA